MRASLQLPLLALSVMLAACGGSDSKPPASGGGGPLDSVNCNAGSGVIEGTFTAPNGTTPVAGANVTVSSAGGCVAVTNAQGKFKFAGVPGSAATITASKGNFVTSGTATPGGTPLQLAIDGSAAKLAYVAGSFDSIQTILTNLGFSPVAIPDAELATTDLSRFDALFLNCGLDETPVDPQSGTTVTTSAIAAYVRAGGTLYASDWAGTYVEATFPGRVTFVGKEGFPTDTPVTAQVIDPSMRSALGASTALITFDLGGWMVIDSAAAGTETLITGPATFGYPEATVTKPYAVRFAHGAGRVTYTSFHNEAQVTGDMKKLLEAMVFGL